METIKDYLAKTESAARKLFEGIDYYIQILENVETPIFVCNHVDDATFKKKLEAWSQKNEQLINEHVAAQNKFVDEMFAESTLCGAVLQIAATGIKKFSKNTEIPEKFQSIKNIQYAKKYCIGRIVNNVPIGLIIYAGRNQYNHFTDGLLREPSRSIFNKIAYVEPSCFVKEAYLEPGLNIENEGIENYSSNITHLLGWRNYQSYGNDMLNLFEEKAT